MNAADWAVWLCTQPWCFSVFYSTVAVSSLILSVMNLLIQIPVLSVYVIPKIKGCLFLQLMSHSLYSDMLQSDVNSKTAYKYYSNLCSLGILILGCSKGVRLIGYSLNIQLYVSVSILKTGWTWLSVFTFPVKMLVLLFKSTLQSTANLHSGLAIEPLTIHNPINSWWMKSSLILLLYVCTLNIMFHSEIVYITLQKCSL